MDQGIKNFIGTDFCNSHCCLQTGILSMTILSVVCLFSFGVKLSMTIFDKMSAKYLHLNNHIFSDSHSFRLKYYSTESVASITHNSSTAKLLFEITRIFWKLFFKAYFKRSWVVWFLTASALWRRIRL